VSITVKNISKMYGAQAALNSVSFEVGKGQVVGLLGPNGAGKSTMMKILAGYIPPTSGQAFVNDLSVVEQSLEVRKTAGYLPEHNPLYLDLYIYEYLQLVAGMYGIKNVRSTVENTIGITGLTPERSKKIGQLSKGYRQRVGLAQALLHNPSVLILDEPTAGLDPNQLADIRQLIREVGKEKTVILSTHIMQEVEAVCSNVIIVNKGQIVAHDTPGNIRRQAQLSSQWQVEVEFLDNINEQLLSQAEFAAQVQKTGNKIFSISARKSEDIRPQIFNFAVENKYTIIGMQQQQKQLEDIFRELTGNT
jgi:ABC-2 type transport system ATP-binding protein